MSKDESFVIKVYGYINEDGAWTFQRAPCIEDGWYIEENHQSKDWKLFEIPIGGGRVVYMGAFYTFNEAHKAAMKLS